MVQAILKGRKTTTRRPLKQPFEVHLMHGCITKPKGNERLVPYKPPYKAGDILYVRETWADTWTPDSNETGFIYKADGEPAKFPYWGNVNMAKDEVWRPSIHMPAKAARIFLKVTNVRVERLQDITDEGAMAEGIDFMDAFEYNGWVPTYNDLDSGGSPAYRATFEHLWNDIYSQPSPCKKNGLITHYESYPWKDELEKRFPHKGLTWNVYGNPWVFVISFERCESEAG